VLKAAYYSTLTACCLKRELLGQASWRAALVSCECPHATPPLLRPRASSAGLRLPARCLVARAAVFMQCWKFIWAAGRDVDAQEGDNTVALRKPQSVHPSCGLCTVVDGNAPCPKELLSWPPKSFKWFGWRDRRSTF